MLWALEGGKDAGVTVLWPVGTRYRVRFSSPEIPKGAKINHYDWRLNHFGMLLQNRYFSQERGYEGSTALDGVYGELSYRTALQL